MAKLSTHILDATHGRPASGVVLRLYKLSDETRELITERETNSDGRTDAPLLEGELETGIYEIEFEIGVYFRAHLGLAETPFLDIVPVRFGINDPSGNYHVPLLASPYSYSTYRGS